MKMERVTRSRKKHFEAVYPKNGVILLNADYSFLHVVKWKKAITLICKGKVEVLKLGKKIVRNFEGTKEIIVPLIMRLIRMVRTLYKNKVPYSKRNVFIRDEFTCAYCGIEPPKLTIEHVVPRDQGGKSTWENTVAACKPCNDRKMNRTPSEAGMYLKRRPFAPTINEFLQIRIRKMGINEVLKEFLAGSVQ
jgi:5-methylcytosine-specific restriction endonuclease McrA